MREKEDLLAFKPKNSLCNENFYFYKLIVLQNLPIPLLHIMLYTVYTPPPSPTLCMDTI